MTPRTATLISEQVKAKSEQLWATSLLIGVLISFRQSDLDWRISGYCRRDRFIFSVGDLFALPVQDGSRLRNRRK
jgi:hypothetical protein